MEYLGRDERYWRHRAEEMRLLAASMRVPEEKAMVLRMAAAYDKLAELTKGHAGATTAADRAADPVKPGE
jgi:hypothetical protein